MGEESENEASFPRLKLGSAEMGDSAEHPSTPPFQASATARVPFKWEEQPGKPRPCIARPEPAKSLELPPCMTMNSADKKFTKTPSPTTVLDGPYNLKFSSFRFFRDGHDSPAFEALLAPAPKKSARGLFGKFKRGLEFDARAGGSCRFSPSTVSTCDSDDMFANNCGLKINTNGSSFTNISPAKPSQLWTSFCHGIKQVMHWKGSSKKSNKQGRHSRSDT